MPQRPAPATALHALLAALCACGAASVFAADPTPSHAPASTPPVAPPAQATPPASGNPQAVIDRIKAAIESRQGPNKVQVIVGESAGPAPHAAAKTATAHAQPRKARLHKAPAAGAHEAHWSYAGPHGPEHWAEMKPEFGACATGQRQSPVHIDEAGTLQGPAEPLVFNHQPSGGSVINNGHTIQVDLDAGNALTVRGSTYQLLQFHFHHPAEEKVNHKGFAMVAHLVHKNDQGQLAVVAVLIDPGTANDLVHKVWTHMPLDTGDRVPLPPGLIDMKELLPQDQRYYQFMGSLTTPPCTEGVLWMVMKQPVTVSREQLKLFAQLFPMNARPVQALNGRVVREGK
ncbi:MAG: carbonate dehydratase [Betaproteobacteria bacterium HGW-Betaproteobacteria-9]|jgi:carbonic anhydrase|nr:MAG: carbonate dehydratase [Betaproteobacteria bacterium HGW-Betaproteobacteria-9]